MYVADMPRLKPGGSVPDNFTGRAWVPPGSLSGRPAPVAIQIDSILSERFKMAVEYFDARSQRVSLQQTAPTGNNAEAR